MPYEIKTAVECQLMIVRHVGRKSCYDLSDAGRTINDLIDWINPRYLLTDIRTVDSFSDLREIFDWRWRWPGRSPSVEKLAFVTNRMQTATVGAIASELLKNGVRVHLFLEEMAALEWLLRSARLFSLRRLNGSWEPE